MAYLIDTNIVLRWVRPSDPLHALARAAIDALVDAGALLYLTPQVLVEFWSVATRPAAVNGLGMTPAAADAEVSRLEHLFPMLTETADIYPAWRQNVVTTGVSGVRTHDARLAAVMNVYGISHVLTFNTADFQGFAGITPVHPQEIVAP